MFHRNYRSDCDVEPFFKIIVCCQFRAVYSDLIFAWFARLRDSNFKMRDSETRFSFSSSRFRDSSLRRRDLETRRKFAETQYFSRTILYPYLTRVSANHASSNWALFNLKFFLFVGMVTIAEVMKRTKMFLNSKQQDACYTGITRDAGADSFIPTVCFAD